MEQESLLACAHFLLPSHLIIPLNSSLNVLPRKRKRLLQRLHTKVEEKMYESPLHSMASGKEEEGFKIGMASHFAALPTPVTTIRPKCRIIVYGSTVPN